MLRIAAAISLLVAAATAMAQPRPMLAESEAVACMTPAVESRGTPVYPPQMLDADYGSTFKVEFRFDSPDEAPAMRVRSDDAVDADFVDAVHDWSRRLRVPCMAAGAGPVRVHQVFAFIPNGGRKVVFSMPRDVAAAEQQRRLDCLTHVEPGSRPDYPDKAMRDWDQGTLLAQLRFASPTAPPEVTLLNHSVSRALDRAVLDFGAGYRLPCLQGGPITVRITYQFFLSGARQPELRDMKLLDFLRGAETVPRPVYFDLDTMACPFDLRLVYYQPAIPSSVGEFDHAAPARQPLLDWLARVKLDLDERTQRLVFGQTITISVPCGKIDL